MKQSAGFGNEFGWLEGTDVLIGAVFRAVFKGYVYVVEFFLDEAPNKNVQMFFLQFFGVWGWERKKTLKTSSELVSVVCSWLGGAMA